jgi:hypothetical protein
VDWIRGVHTAAPLVSVDHLDGDFFARFFAGVGVGVGDHVFFLHFALQHQSCASLRKMIKNVIGECQLVLEAELPDLILMHQTDVL